MTASSDMMNEFFSPNSRDKCGMLSAAGLLTAATRCVEPVSEIFLASGVAMCAAGAALKRYKEIEALHVENDGDEED